MVLIEETRPLSKLNRWRLAKVIKKSRKLIQKRTILICADNSGAIKLQCICIVGKGKAKYAQIGDIITCSVKKVEPL